jgi:ABC-type enterobactin transport system permease subunit
LIRNVVVGGVVGGLIGLLLGVLLFTSERVQNPFRLVGIGIILGAAAVSGLDGWRRRRRR